MKLWILNSFSFLSSVSLFLSSSLSHSLFNSSLNTDRKKFTKENNFLKRKSIQKVNVHKIKELERERGRACDSTAKIQEGLKRERT